MLVPRRRKTRAALNLMYRIIRLRLDLFNQLLVDSINSTHFNSGGFHYLRPNMDFQALKGLMSSISLV